MDEQFAPSTHNWIVCLTHCKRLQNCIWESMNDTPPDVMKMAHKPCDQCLSEEAGDEAETLSLRDPDSPRLGLPVG